MTELAPEEPHWHEIAKAIYDLNPANQPWDGDRFEYHEEHSWAQHNQQLAQRQAVAVLGKLAQHYHLVPKVEPHPMRVGMINMQPDEEEYGTSDPVLTVHFDGIPSPGRLFDLDELAAALMAAHAAKAKQ
ncbi:hypothetical protein SEA_SKOG_91 [Gordonia phage Skog]|uniref:Uncharacterized protein n=1 Tax=Gordonia phage Skog TaxID=2704033 RepID=A0A6G6XKE1_9CAUD|nr:hypothetical protein KHQ85_gp091 [Gordonia phage Skog]QIG58243.1 hypothetical protein SEA_SKOG_91 [Gordonia phage Skog]